MTNRIGILPVATIAAAILLIALVFCLLVNWPGHLSYDSVIQLYEGRFAAYDNWHPPIMSWLLGLLDAVVPGAGLFVAFDSILLFACLISVLFLPRQVSRWAVPAALAVCVLPQTLLYPAIAWKDVLFAIAALAGFILLAHAARHWPRRGLRFGLIAAALLAFALAALARQNGSIVLLAGVLTLGFVAQRNAEGLLKAGGYALAGLIGAVLIMQGASLILQRHYTGVSGPERQITLLHLYDLSGAKARDPALSLSVLEGRAPALAKLVERDGARFFTPQRNDTLHNSPALQDALYNTPPTALRAQWIDFVSHHFGDYLALRWEIFRWVFATPDILQCVPFVVGVDGPQPIRDQLHIAERLDGRDRMLRSYGYAFAATPLLWHPLFALLSVGLAVFLLRRRRAEDFAIAGLQLAALGFTASFFVISIACDYRYLYFLDISALAGLLYVAADPRLKV